MDGKVRIGDREIRYKVRRGNSSKYLSLRLKPDLELEIILPRKMKIDIKEVLKKKRAWIEKKCNELLSKKRIFDGNQILYKGVPYDIKVIKDAKRPAIKLDRKARTITICAGQRIPLLVLKKWMQKRTRDYVREKVNDYAKALGVKFNGIFIRSIKK
jgi:predicted metal-dependent hydrolase